MSIQTPVVLVNSADPGAHTQRFWFSSSGECLHFNEVTSTFRSRWPRDHTLKHTGLACFYWSPGEFYLRSCGQSFLVICKVELVIRTHQSFQNQQAHQCVETWLPTSAITGQMYQFAHQHSYVKAVLVSEMGGIKTRTLAHQAELQQAAPRMPSWWPGLQIFGFGWLLSLLIKTEKWPETDWVHVHHNPWLNSISFLQFSSWKKDRWLKKIFSSGERKQTINQHLFNHVRWVLSQRVLHMFVMNHLVGKWLYHHSSTDEERERQGVKFACDHTASKRPWRVLALGLLSLNPVFCAINTALTTLVVFWLCFPYGDAMQENRDTVMGESKPNNRTRVYWGFHTTRPILWILKENREIAISDEWECNF